MSISKSIRSRKSNADERAKAFRLSPRARNIVRDPVRFIQTLKIRDKRGKVIRLKLTDEQRKMLNSLMLDDKGTLVLKARQIGASTVTSAYLFWKWYCSTEPITIALLSHKLESAKQLFKMFQRFYAQLPKDLRRPLEVQNTQTLKLQDSGAEILALSSQGEGGLRSFTANYIHISEFAFASDPEELMATARAALNEGKLIIESTANYYNDCLHIEVLKAQRGEADWDYNFFPWYEHGEYKTEIPLDGEGTSLIEWSAEELSLMRNIDGNRLSKEQVYWRRKQIEKFGHEKFRREYPATVEDAYAQTGDAYFSDLTQVQILNVHFPPDLPILLVGSREYGTRTLESIQKVKDAEELIRRDQENPLPRGHRRTVDGGTERRIGYEWDKDVREWVKYDKGVGGKNDDDSDNIIGAPASLPISEQSSSAVSSKIEYNDDGQRLHTIQVPLDLPGQPKFAIGVDVAGGNGRDYSTIVVLDKVSMMPCALFRSNTISLKDFSDVILHLANSYNKATVLVERNMHGHAILAYLQTARYSNIANGTDGKPGWHTNVKTKNIMFEDLKYLLSQGALPFCDQVTYSELRSYIVNSRGNIEFPSNIEGHGDMVIALALAYQAWKLTSFPRSDGMDNWVNKKKAKERSAAYNATSKQRY